MVHGMKWISTAVVVLLLSSLSVAAQTVTGYCMKYDQRHWLYQKDGQVNVIDMDIEWPMAASNADITPLQTFLAQEAFGLESKNYNDILPSFLQRFGEPVTKKFETIPDDSAFCYVNVKTTLLGYQPGRYISMCAEYDCAPQPRSMQKKENRTAFVTYDIAQGKLLLMKDIINLKKLDQTRRGERIFYMVDDYGMTTIIVVRNACLGQGDMYVSSIDGTCYNFEWSLMQQYATTAARKLMEKKGTANVSPVNYTLDNIFEGKPVYEKTDQPATFLSNGMNIRNYLTQHLRLPEEPGEHSIGSLVKVSVVIDENGQVNDVAVVTPCSPGIDREVVRVVKTMPLWTPATVGGQNVCSRLILPIEFK